MSTNVFYSDRANGSAVPTLDALPQHTREGLVGLVGSKVASHWFAREFPLRCPDGPSVCGTDVSALAANLKALIPGAPWPLKPGADVSDEVVLDLVEYAAAHVEKPIETDWHSFFRHYELSFDQKAGYESFHDEVNQILERGHVMFELTKGGRVRRTGTLQVQTVLQRIEQQTGDNELNRLLDEARRQYTSHKAERRRSALDRLWDAFSRLKTLEIPGGETKANATALLKHVPGPQWRGVVEAEMIALNNIGNDFNIRHHETRVTALPSGSEDYLFARMGSLIAYLLSVREEPDS